MIGEDWVRHGWGWDARGMRGRVRGLSFSLSLGRKGLGSEWADLACALSPRPGAPAEPCGFDRLHAFLSGTADEPVARRALAMVDGGILPPGTAALIAPDRADQLGRELFYCLDWRRGPGRAEAATRHPALSEVLDRVVFRVDGRFGSARLDPRDLLARYWPGARPGSIRAVLRLDRPIPTAAVLDALLAIPPERHPRGEAETRAFEAIAEASEPLVELLGGHGHLDSAGAGWAAFAETLGRRLPDAASREPGLLASAKEWPALSRACMDVRDLAETFSRQVLVPLLHARGHGDEALLLWLSGSGETDFATWDSAATSAAGRLLAGGKSLPAILELSAGWHARQRAVDTAVAGIDAALGTPRTGTAMPTSWPVPFGPVTVPNGVEIAFLGSQAELAEEGAALGHCVAGYGPACASGSSTVASLRLRRGDRVERLSTAEASFGNGSVRIVQHRGRANAAPPPKADAAIAWLVGEVAEGRLAPAAPYLERGWRASAGRQGISGRAGYAHLAPGAAEAAVRAWSPFLTRPLRDPDVLSAAGDGLVRQLAPTMPGWAPPRRRSRRARAMAAYEAACKAVVFPLQVGDWLSERIDDLTGLGKSEAVAIATAAGVEVLFLWAAHALLGRGWIVALGLQLAIPAALALAAARHVPGALARTGRHMARAGRDILAPPATRAGPGRPGGGGTRGLDPAVRP